MEYFTDQSISMFNCWFVGSRIFRVGLLLFCAHESLPSDVNNIWNYCCDKYDPSNDILEIRLVHNRERL